MVFKCLPPAQTTRGLVLALLALLVLPTAMFAQTKGEEDDKPADPDTGESTVAESTLGVLPNPFERKGIKFAATYIGEVLGNAGGSRQGATYEGRLNLAVDADLHKLIGWPQLSFHANIFQIHGDGLSRTNLRNLMVVSGIEALPSTRLYEAWFEQKFGKENGSIRAGQLAADSEFITSKYTDVFTNASLGWPAITSVDLPSGGPSPPLAAPGARLRLNLTDTVTALAAVFDGDAAGPGVGDPQSRNRYGLNFRLSDPPLVLTEIQLGWGAKKGNALPGTFKLGAWTHFGSFADARFTSGGLSIADPSGSGIAAQLRSDAGIYGVAEQLVFRKDGTEDHGIGLFGRISASPSDRNLVDLYADAGVEAIGLFDARPADKFGVAVGYARISGAARALDRDYRLFVRPDWPLRSFEGLVTAAYQYEVRAGWTLQPNLQYILHPGGGATDPGGPAPGKALHNAMVLGLRTVLKF